MIRVFLMQWQSNDEYLQKQQVCLPHGSRVSDAAAAQRHVLPAEAAGAACHMIVLCLV